MVKKILNIFSKESNGLHETAYLLGFFTIMAQVLSLVRDRLLAHNFGAGEILDIYYAAFRIPDFIFISAASIVSISVLVPFLVEKIDRSTEEGNKFIQDIFSFFFIMIIGVSAVAYILAPWIVKLIFPGFVNNPYMMENIIDLTRILLLSPILLGFSNFFASITQAKKRFFAYALSPVLYNVGIVIGIIFFYPIFDLRGLVYGVVLGALLHMLIQLPYVVRAGFMPKFSFSPDYKSIGRVITLSISRTFALSASHISLIFLLAFASLMAAGSISIFNFSYNLQSVPIAVIGASYSVALFPTLARLFSKKDLGLFMDKIVLATRHILFWSFPFAILFIVLRAQIVRTILGSGEFLWSDTRLTAAALAMFAVSLVAQNMTLLFVRGYYASGNTKKPLVINSISAALIVIFSYLLIKFFNASILFQYFIEALFKVEDISGTVSLMLPLGFSLGSIFNLLLFWIFFEKDFGNFIRRVSGSFFETFSASVIMGFVSYQFLKVFDDIFNLDTLIGIFLQGFISGILGIIAGVAILLILKNKEIKEVLNTLHKRIWRVKPVISEQESL